MAVLVRFVHPLPVQCLLHVHLTHMTDLLCTRPRPQLMTVPTFGGGLVTKSCPSLVTPWSVAHQTPLSMGFPKQDYRSGLTFPSPGDLPNPGIKPTSPVLQADSFTAEPSGKPSECYTHQILPAYLLSVKCPISKSPTNDNHFYNFYNVFDVNFCNLSH